MLEQYVAHILRKSGAPTDDATVQGICEAIDGRDKMTMAKAYLAAMEACTAFLRDRQADAK